MFNSIKIPTNLTQLNSTSSCRHVHSVNNRHLSMNVVTQLTGFVGRDVVNKNTTDLAVRCITGSVELSWVLELCRFKHPLKRVNAALKCVCVSESRLTNVCRHTTYTTSSGYLVSPKFPDMYPNRRNCTCALSAPAGSRVLIGTAFLLVKNNEPCRDWLSLRVDSAPEVRRCGYIPQSEHVFGNSAVINFRSDKTEREMGFWLYFRGKQHAVDPLTDTMFVLWIE